MKRPPRPVLQHKGVALVWNKSRNRWRFRAAIRVEGQQLTGLQRDTQLEAARDVAELRDCAGGPRVDGTPVSMLDAARAAIDDAVSRGVSPESVEGVYRKPWRNGPFRYWIARDVRMDGIDETEVRAFIRWARERVEPRTINRDWLRVLHQGFELAKVPSPVPRARKAMANLLEPIVREMPYFLDDEFRGLMARVRGYVGEKGRGTVHNERDATYFELVATTGVRMFELGRVRIRDIDTVRWTIELESKVKSRPRQIPVAELIRPAVLRLMAGKGPGDPLVENQWRTLNSRCEVWKKRLDEPRLNLRALRHTFATSLLRQGANIKEVADLLGHSPTSNAVMRYVHAVASEKAREQQHLAERLLRPPGPDS